MPMEVRAFIISLNQAVLILQYMRLCILPGTDKRVALSIDTLQPKKQLWNACLVRAFLHNTSISFLFSLNGKL
jgi:hypothetical protein